MASRGAWSAHITDRLEVDPGQPSYAMSFAEHRTTDPHRMALWVERFRRSGCFISNALFVDLGCGVGRVTCPLSHYVSETFGVDRDAEMLRIAEQRCPGPIRWVQALAEATPLPDESVDVSLASMLIEHVAKKAELFSEIGRIMRRGGTFILRTMLPDDVEQSTWYKYIPKAADLERARTIGLEEIEGLAKRANLVITAKQSFRDRVAEVDAARLPRRIRDASYEILRQMDGVEIEQACLLIEREMECGAIIEYNSSSMVLLKRV